MASPSQPKQDRLIQLQLPSGNFRAPNEAASSWSKLSHQEQRPSSAIQPARPQIGRKILAKPENSLLSPRQKIPAPPTSSPATSATVTSPVRSKSARTHPSPSIIAIGQHETADGKQRPRPASSPVSRDRDSPVKSLNKVESPYLLPISTRSREHIEIKACLLAHTHRLDVEELHRVRGNNQLALNKSKMQRIISQGGAFGGHEEAKRKTTFLLRHFFMLDDISNSVPYEQLLCDVIEDWACGDQATSDDISKLWKAIDNHIEQSYLLRRTLVSTSDPDELSITIAMDCLKHLPYRLPEYRRVLDVIIALVESGLYTSDSSITFSDSSEVDGIDRPPVTRKRFYFEEYRVLQVQTKGLDRVSTKHGANYTSQENSIDMPAQQRIKSLLGQVQDDQDKKGLLVQFLRGDMTELSRVASEEIVKYYFGPNGAEDSDFFYSLLMQQADPDQTARFLAEIMRSHANELQNFVVDNMDGLFALSRDSSKNDMTVSALFQRLVDRHPQEFASILWHSPYLTAHIFQGSEHLVARVLEQNVYRVSQVLTQRIDVLTPLLSHTFRDNTSVLEEFLVNHPRGLADLLMNRSSAIAAEVKAKPYILSDLLQACHQTLTKVLASTPDIVSSVMKSNPQVLPQIVREDFSILSTVFAMVPQSLGNALERNPEFLADVAHRKPALVSRMFAEHPDLLLEPLEANPALFTTFLAYHRDILPDLSDPDFDSAAFKLRTKITADSGVQTSKQSGGKCRFREKLRQRSEKLLEPLRIASDKEHFSAATQLSMPHSSELSKSEAILVMEGNLTTGELVNEVARVYVAKIAADEHDDAINRKRQSLADFVLDHYTIELGLKNLAKRKLVNLLLAAKQVGGEPEAKRIKWFRRFLNAIPGDRYLPDTALDFYLLVLQRLIPASQLMLRLEAGMFGDCTVPPSSLKTLVDDSLVSRLFDSKEQRQRLLAIESSPPQDIPKSAIQLDDLLDMVMKIWLQYQQRIRDQWATVFSEIAPTTSGVASFDVFASVVRSKLPVLDSRDLMKVYNSCGDENEQAEFILYSEDFTLAMTILQEQHTLRQYPASSTSTASSAVPFVSERHN